MGEVTDLRWVEQDQSKHTSYVKKQQQETAATMGP